CSHSPCPPTPPLSLHDALPISFSQASGAKSTGIYALSGQLAPQTPVSITSQPTNATVNELSPVSFVAGISGNPYPGLQWYKNGSVIAGATSAAYFIPAAALADNGANFWLVASNFANSIGYGVTSSVATLTVIADTNPPVLLGAQSLGLSRVQASFSERITPSTATNLSNYVLTGSNGAV